MNERYEVAVIGAGIVGVSTALHLLMRGKKVALIDRREPGRETSYGNAGIIQSHDTLPFGFPPLSRIPKILLNLDPAVRVHYPSLFQYTPWILQFYWQSRPKARKRNGRLMRPLNAVALDEHRALMRGTGAERYLSPAGRIAIYRSMKSFASSAWELDFAAEMGVPFEVADPEEIVALEPYVKPAFYKAVRWTSSTRFTNPGAITTAYAEKFVSEGGTVLRANVLGLAKEETSWRLEISGQIVDAEDIVVCAGPWASKMLEPLGYNFPLGIKRGYHQHYAAEGGATFAHAFADIDIGYVMAPMEEGLRIDTGAEFADMDTPPDSSQLTDLLPYARQLFPLGKALGDQIWCGGRPCFVDSMPAIGPSRHAGLWLNIGHGHSGMTIGPSSGRLLAELMTGQKTFCDASPYHPARFNC